MTENQLLTELKNLEADGVIRASFPSIISYKNSDTGDFRSFCFKNGKVTEVSDGVFFELHRLILKNISECRAVFQPYSHWGCVWAAFGKGIPPMSMIHAKNFFGEIPCTGEMYLEQINGNLAGALYDQVKALYDKSFPYKLNAALLDQIGPLLFGNTVADVIEKARYLEEAAEIAYKIRSLEGIRYRHMHYALMEKFYTEGLEKLK